MRQLRSPPLLFGGTLVPKTTSITLLCVKVDAKMTFGDHLHSVATRACQRLGVLNRAANILTPSGRTTVYKAFVRPFMALYGTFAITGCITQMVTIILLKIDNGVFANAHTSNC